MSQDRPSVSCDLKCFSDWRDAMEYNNPLSRELYYWCYVKEAIVARFTADEYFIQFYPLRLDAPGVPAIIRHEANYLASDFRDDSVWRMLQLTNAVAVGTGPKVFSPTALESESMRHIKMNLPLSSYEQPFRSVIINLSKETQAAHAATVKGRRQSPICIVMTHFKEQKRLSLRIIYSGTSQNHILVYLDAESDPSLEEYLVSTPFAQDEDVDHFQAMWRIGVNSCLLMTHYSWIANSANPDRAAKLRDLLKKSKKARPEVREANRVELETQALLLSFEQHVKVYKERRDTDEPHIPKGMEGSVLRPHWREGHWFYQAYGPGHSLHRRLFRRPSLVNGHLFAGKLCDTTVNATL